MKTGTYCGVRCEEKLFLRHGGHKAQRKEKFYYVKYAKANEKGKKVMGVGV